VPFVKQMQSLQSLKVAAVELGIAAIREVSSSLDSGLDVSVLLTKYQRSKDKVLYLREFLLSQRSKGTFTIIYSISDDDYVLLQWKK